MQVAPDGRRLSDLIQLLARGTLTVSVGERFSLDQGAAALAQVRRGSHGTVIVLRPRSGTAFRPRREQPTPQARPVGRDQPAPDAVLANVPVQ